MAVMTASSIIGASALTLSTILFSIVVGTTALVFDVMNVNAALSSLVMSPRKWLPSLSTAMFLRNALLYSGEEAS